MISAVVVSYRSAELARAALASFRREAERAGEALETIAVVNSGDAAEAGALRSAADTVLLPERNLGFAGGLNAGIRAARGDTLFLANPDLLLAPGALAELAAAARGGLRAAGPAFFWDEGEAVFQPPAEEPRPMELRRRLLERRRPEARERLFRRELSRVLAAREAAREGRRLSATSLRGALVAMTRETLARVGPFDEEFALYFEENDWQRRLLAAGGRLVYAGGAHVVHRYNRSARLEPRAAEWFAASQRRYYARHFGERGSRALAELAAEPDAGAPSMPALAEIRWTSDRRVGVALSPLASFRPFLLALPATGARSWHLPEEIRAGIAGETWLARVFELETGAALLEGRLPA